MCVCVCVHVRACVGGHVRARVCACVRVRARLSRLWAPRWQSPQLCSGRRRLPHTRGRHLHSALCLSACVRSCAEIASVFLCVVGAHVHAIVHCLLVCRLHCLHACVYTNLFECAVCAMFIVCVHTHCTLCVYNVHCVSCVRLCARLAAESTVVRRRLGHLKREVVGMVQRAAPARHTAIRCHYTVITLLLHCYYTSITVITQFITLLSHCSCMHFMRWVLCSAAQLGESLWERYHTHVGATRTLKEETHV